MNDILTRQIPAKLTAQIYQLIIGEDVICQKYNVQIKMTEGNVFKILLQKEKLDYDFDCPKQQLETVKLISKNLSEIIYETYKHKSLASSSKRYQILKFINNVCVIPDNHEYEDYTKCILKQLNEKGARFKNEEVTNFAEELTSDLENYENNRSLRYYTRKINREREKRRKIDILNEKMQEKLSNKSLLEVKKRYIFEPNEILMKKILGINDVDKSLSDRFRNIANQENRNTDITLSYALLNMGETDLLENIFDKISKHKNFINSERNFLRYTWITQNKSSAFFVQRYINAFYFLLEETILKQASDLLGIESQDEADEYFTNLRNNGDILKLREVCKYDYNCYLKLKTLLFELYCLSYCNENIIKLIEFIS
ncbi:unnamed protein product [Phyllotreta striolata]|uniref:Uncharacterized protein n=1 Tax=Phyllotreta striolata TaxID=444603 RepID=A0A9N9TLT6_PHYSR|nr:unnamed protein product [Phyllotreta striolata]